MLTRPQTRGGSGAIQPKAQNALTLAPVRAAQINGCDAVGARLIANPNCTTAIAVRTRVNPSKAVCAALSLPLPFAPAGHGSVADSLPLWHSAHDRLDVSGASPRLYWASRAKL